MTRLILTTNDSGSGALKGARIADIVIPFGYRFVWGPLPSDTDIATSLMTLSSQHDQADDNWSFRIYRKHLGDIDSRTGLIDLCELFDTIELWIDPDPNAQLILIWLLDYLRPHEKIVSKLFLVQADTPIGSHGSEEVAAWRIPAIKILNGHLEIAGLAWQAYRAPTPRDWFDLLPRDLSLLPCLRPAVVMLLEELPMPGSGLGATEMRMLELISEGNAFPFDVFPGHQKRNERRVFGYWEVGSLLDDLARCPAPAVSDLDEGPFTLEMHDDRDRHERYKRSRLSLTELGKAVVAKADDFSRHNPIHRWWGGTELTNDRLWRWDKPNSALIAP
ncbi:hypothetical protein [Bradyrhizobium canariense]|uniref:DUF1835 domain-containing protein n=1 Tax=Bradyrhizobium canariense TaxID=255045 RepID=A0A1H1MRS1_9BRAD|nr:hypothetical protein [Bradyrhizobium canariense]SDR88589.1 hypothetical protein SAMN05444158_0307 [Bradyrhizobium canariense]